MENSDRREAVAIALVLVFSVAVFVALGGVGAAGSMAQASISTPSPTATVTPRPTPTATASPTPTPTSTATPTPLPTATATPTATPSPWRRSDVKIPARSIHTLAVPLAAGEVLEGFFTTTQDVGFSVVGPEGTLALDQGRVRGPHSFTVVATSAGSYTLRFDNSYSWLTPKTIQLSWRTRAASHSDTVPAIGTVP
ncbi:MAG: emp24/gp25L/p24 family protein [Chloroflexi bacterium]|nr:emp24/gp25L/p24 family protein [Chloroflexota bacterium]